MLRFKVRDLVNTTDEYGGRTFCIVERFTSGYKAVALKDHKRYKITDKQIQCKVGEVPTDSPLLEYDAYDPEEGRAYCHRQGRKFVHEAPQWAFLASLNPGDDIVLVHRKQIVPATFVQINTNKPRFPIRARFDSRDHDFHLEALLLDLQQNESGV